MSLNGLYSSFCFVLLSVTSITTNAQRTPQPPHQLFPKVYYLLDSLVFPTRLYCDSRFQTRVTCRLGRGCPLLDAHRHRKRTFGYRLYISSLFVFYEKSVWRIKPTGCSNMIIFIFTFIFHGIIKCMETLQLVCDNALKDHVNSYSFPKVDTIQRNIHFSTGNQEYLVKSPRR